MGLRAHGPRAPGGEATDGCPHPVGRPTPILIGGDIVTGSRDRLDGTPDDTTHDVGSPRCATRRGGRDASPGSALPSATAGLTPAQPAPEDRVFPFMRRTTPEIGPDQLEERLRDGTVRVIDVRDDWEYARGHVPGAAHLPLHQLQRRAPELERDVPYAVICESGGRSLDATDYLLRIGFADVVSVRGGTFGWIRTGRPLER
jgi:rhodanese-related sulfurtransferase